VELSDSLLCLFSAELEAVDDQYVIEIPRREIEAGAVDVDDVYRVAMIANQTGTHHSEQSVDHPPGEPQPPVEVGEVRYVEIEDLGKQGDGIARVERGYVIIVPDTDIGDRVKIEIGDVKSNFAVGEVIDE